MPALATDARRLLASADTQKRKLGSALQDARATQLGAKIALTSIDKLAREYVRQGSVLDRLAKARMNEAASHRLWHPRVPRISGRA